MNAAVEVEGAVVVTAPAQVAAGVGGIVVISGEAAGGPAGFLELGDGGGDSGGDKLVVVGAGEAGQGDQPAGVSGADPPFRQRGAHQGELRQVAGQGGVMVRGVLAFAGA